MKKTIKKYSSGKFFSPNAVFFGFVFLLLVIGLIVWDFYPEFRGLSKSYVSFLILPFPVYLIFTSYGVEIDFEKSKIREYKKVMGFINRKGTNENIDQKYITVLPKLRSYTMQTSANMSSSVSKSMLTVALISENYRNQKEVWITENKEQAYKVANEIADSLNIELIKYDPKKFRDEIKNYRNN